jgi:hypothetical protein
LAAVVDDLEAHPAGVGPERESRGLKEGILSAKVAVSKRVPCWWYSVPT